MNNHNKSNITKSNDSQDNLCLMPNESELNLVSMLLSLYLKDLIDIRLFPLAKVNYRSGSWPGWE